MTGAQASYLKTLSEECDAPECFETNLTKAEASKRIDALKSKREFCTERQIPMSRAFVKEIENDTTGLPDRPISPDRNFVTEAGLAEIEAALNRFEAAHRAALESGDRNAAAAASREIRYWGSRRASAEVVKTSEQRLAPHLATHHNRAGRIQPNHAAHVLAEVDAKHTDIHSLSSSESPGDSTTPEGGAGHSIKYRPRFNPMGQSAAGA